MHSENNGQMHLEYSSEYSFKNCNFVPCLPKNGVSNSACIFTDQYFLSLNVPCHIRI